MASATTKAATRKRAKPRPTDTRQRIVTRAIALFNRYGIQNVAIDHIASDLKISPGNLTYHFKRKDDLIRQTLEVLKDNLRVALERPVAVSSANDGAEYLVRVYRTLWDFRFFFNSLAFLLQDDRQLRKEYREFRDWLLDTMEADLVYMAESGVFQKAVAPNTFRLLAENIWGQFMHWLRLQQIETPSAATPSAEAIYDAVLHLWSLCQHWLNPTFAVELLEVFQVLLVPEASKPEPRTIGKGRKRKA